MGNPEGNEVERVGLIPEDGDIGRGEAGCVSSTEDTEAAADPGTVATLDRAPIPGLVPGGDHSQVVRGDFLQMGKAEQALGAAAAEEFLNEPDPFDEARRSAAARLGTSSSL